MTLKSLVLEEDLKQIAESDLPFEQYRNQTFLITGATGLIGSLLIKALLYMNEVHKLNLHVIGVIRNPDKAKKIYEEFASESALQFIVQDLEKPFDDLTQPIDFIIHTAAVTASAEMIAHPVNMIQTTLTGTISMLRLAQAHSARMVYVSSMEIYGTMENSEGKTYENELGYIDLHSVRSGYPESKRMCECLCNSYASQYGVHVVSARLAQTFGAGILPGENRVFAQFARSAIHGENIILHTQGLSEGNYVYTVDAVRALLLLLTVGCSGEAYNVVNEESHTTIREMAEMVAEQFGSGQISVVYDIPEDVKRMGYAPDVKLYLSSEKLNRLGWHATTDLKKAYIRMISYMKEQELT